jgi:hypothetical protein
MSNNITITITLMLSESRVQQLDAFISETHRLTGISVSRQDVIKHGLSRLLSDPDDEVTKASDAMLDRIDRRDQTI